MFHTVDGGQQCPRTCSGSFREQLGSARNCFGIFQGISKNVPGFVWDMCVNILGQVQESNIKTSKPTDKNFIEAHKDEIIKKEFKNSDVTINRFKGLGEMMPAQLKETTMSQENRTLLKVQIASKDKKKTHKSVDSLMGKKPELRFKFIVENSKKIAAESIL